MTTTDTLAGSAIELASMAGLELTAEQNGRLITMLATRDDGSWVSRDAVVLDEPDAALYARLLAGLLLLDERIVWTAASRRDVRHAFDRISDLLHRVVALDASMTDLKVCRRNGEERIWRTGTAGSVRFMTHLTGCRGLTFDTAIIQDSERWPLRQQDDLLPCMASARNPQIIRA